MKNKHAFLDPPGWSIFGRPALHEKRSNMQPLLLQPASTAFLRCGAAAEIVPPRRWFLRRLWEASALQSNKPSVPSMSLKGERHRFCDVLLLEVPPIS